MASEVDSQSVTDQSGAGASGTVVVVGLSEANAFGMAVRLGSYDAAGVELGLYFVCLTFCMLALLDQVRGKPKRLQNWLLYRKVAIFHGTSRNSARIQKVLTLLLWFYMGMPFVTLLGWAILVLYDCVQEDNSVASAICILLLGIATMLFGYNVLRVKWSNYRFKTINLIAFLIVILLITLYQFLIAFAYAEGEKFLPYSAIFLNVNVILLSILVFLSKYKDFKGTSHLVSTFFPPTGQALDRDRENDMIQEIEAQRKDPNWKQSQEDLMDIVTISRVSGEKFDSATGSGLLMKFKAWSPRVQRGAQLSLLAVAYSVVVLYAIVLAAADDGNKLGFVTAISVVLMDLYNFMLYNSSAIETPSGIIFLLILNRALMIGLGQNYWIYGYMILYLIYGAVFVYQLTQNRFPFESDIVLKNSKVEGFIKSIKDKKGAGEILKIGFRNPEILLTILTLFYMILMLVISFADFQGLDLKHLEISIPTTEVDLETQTPQIVQLEVQIPYWLCGLLTILMALSFYTVLALARIFIRTATRADIYGQTVDSCLNRNQYLSLMDFYIIFNFCLCMCWAGFAFWATDKGFVFIYGALAPFSIMFFAKGYVYFVLNEYDYFQDVAKLNRHIDRHNKSIAEMEQRKSDIQKALVDGTLVLPQLGQDGQPSAAPRPSVVVQPQPPPPGPQQPGPEPGATDGGRADDASGGHQPGGVVADQDQGGAGKNQEEQKQQDEEQMRLQKEQEQAMIQELVAQEQERKRQEEEQRQKQLAENAELARQEEEERQKMEEQMRLEREREQEQREEAERLRVQKMQEEAEKQRAEEARRRKEEAEKPKVQQESTPYNFSGQMQMGFVPPGGGQKRGGGYAEEEMYEGGDDADDSRQPALGGRDRRGSALSSSLHPDQQVIDPTKEYIDIDEAEKNRQQKKIASTRLKRVADWRLRYPNWVKAYKEGGMRPNDKKFVNSMAASVAFTLLLMIVLYVDMKAFIAVISFLPFAYFAICLLIASAVIYQSRTFTIKELIIWATINVLYLVCGVLYFIAAYEVSEFKYDLDQRSDEQHTASYFVFCYILAMPTLAHGLVVILRLCDRGTENFDIKFRVFAGTFLFGILLMVLSTFIFVHWIDGLIFVGAILLIIYAISQFALYIKNDYYLKPILQVINSILVVCCILFATMYALGSDELSTYEGVSYSAAALLFFLWAYALFQFARDLFEFAHRPLYFSATLFPIYKYSQKKNDVEDHYGPAIAWMIGLFLLMFWAYLTNYSIVPEWYGVVATISVELLFLLSIINMRQITLDSFSTAAAFIDQETVKKAWIETKSSYIKSKGAFSRQNLQTYRRMWARRYYLNNLINVMRDPSGVEPVGEGISEDVKAEVQMPQGMQAKEFFQSKVSEFLEERYDVTDIYDLAHSSYRYDMIVHETYLEEMQQVLQFIMISVQNSLLVQDQRKKGFIRFLVSKKDTLHALGISIQVPTKGTINMKWEQIENQIDELQPKEKNCFERLRLLYENEQQAKREVSSTALEEQKRQNDARERAAEELRRKKEEQLAELERKRREEAQQQLDQIGTALDIPQVPGGGGISADNLDPNGMPDCRLKYELIVKRSKQSGEKFTDTQFPANEDSLGDEVCGYLSGVQWHRMSARNQYYTIFEDGVDVNDVEQGQLGDCYFLSAMVVLGNKLTRDKFVFIEADDEWERCGAYCVKFYDQGKEDIVIVDDHMPMQDDRFVFVTTPTGKELWPCIIEKAYAKKYGSYSAIAGGLVDLALSELTNGIPESYDREENQNLQKLWDKAMDAQSEGSFLGAGSPAHPDGDKAKSDTGIVQGHAYSVLRLAEVDGIKLIQLRNPWGSSEWNGDWSDDSEHWTTRMKNVLNYNSFEDNGVFWMDFNDFMEEFDTIYVCRNYTNQPEWKNLLIEDEWKGQYAEGLPTAGNSGAKMQKNPQYGITVTKPGRGYLVMRLREKESAYKSKHYGYLNLQQNDGKVITYSSMRKKEVGHSGPVNRALQPLEVHFPPALSYPYTFTAIVANTEHGEDGEGGFSLQVFSKDHTMAVAKLN